MSIRTVRRNVPGARGKRKWAWRYICVARHEHRSRIAAELCNKKQASS